MLTQQDFSLQKTLKISDRFPLPGDDAFWSVETHPLGM